MHMLEGLRSNTFSCHSYQKGNCRRKAQPIVWFPTHQCIDSLLKLVKGEANSSMTRTTQDRSFFFSITIHGFAMHWHVWKVSAAMPIDPETKRILLVSSSKHPGAWVFVSSLYQSTIYCNAQLNYNNKPKGGWENDESSEQAAERETYEEGKISLLAFSSPPFI